MRPIEAKRDDSGVVNLNVINATATPEQVIAAEKAKPAASGLFDEEEKPVAATTSAAAPVVVADAGAKVVALPAKKKGSGGLVIGALVAVLGLAAAFALTKMNKPNAPPPAPIAAEVKPSAPEANLEPAAAAPQPTSVAVTEPGANPVPPVGADQGAAPSGGGDSKLAAAAPSGASGAPPPSGAQETAGTAGDKSAATGKPATTASASTPAKPGDLAGAMAQAVGSDGDKKAAPSSENAEPAAGERNQSIPEQPPQGSVQAAIRTVTGSAKACVAGADDVSRAQITFSSNGTVNNVSVTGWASSHGAVGCIKAALQAAKVGPFSKSTYTVGMTIRP